MKKNSTKSASFFDLPEVFNNELCSYSSALFENKYTPRAANKALLSDALWKFMPTDGSVPNDDILDGGALLYRLPWKQGTHIEKYVNSTVSMSEVTMGNQK